jgi:hypothetical protein
MYRCPLIKLNERMKRTFFNSKPKILIVVPFNRSTSCSVNPKLLTSSIFRKDSVVAPASEVVSLSISTDTFFFF